MVAELDSSINRQVDDYNHWIMSSQKKFEIKNSALDVQRNAMKDMETTINQTLEKLNKRKPHLDSKKEITDYNRMVEQNKAMIEKRNSFIKEYKKIEASYNQAVSQYNSNAKQTMVLIDQAKSDAKKKISEYNTWRDSDNDMEFFNALNTYYEQLLKEQKRIPGTFTKSSEIRAIKKIRKELANFTRKKYEKNNNGLIIIEALLCDREKAFFLVDTGATTTTIHPAMLNALGINIKSGEESEYKTAGGIKRKARGVTIPRISINGKSATNVEAAVLPPTDVGIDGLLGHSFLNHFNYRIEKKDKPELILIKK